MYSMRYQTSCILLRMSAALVERMQMLGFHQRLCLARKLQALRLKLSASTLGGDARHGTPKVWWWARKSC
ncbi:hypothetical protein FHW75_003968 [Pseudomonas sp. OG7]|nr:hypothetical protein [Pseudomonas sp. OG7]